MCDPPIGVHGLSSSSDARRPQPGRPRNGGVLGYLAFAVASVVATHAVFFGEDRYHMVLTPALAILAACALRRHAPEGVASDAVVR